MFYAHDLAPRRSLATAIPGLYRHSVLCFFQALSQTCVRQLRNSVSLAGPFAGI